MTNRADHLLEANRAQTIAETDGFTLDRYAQFERALPSHAVRILDVGCGTGRGGSVLKAARPQLVLIGMDCLSERVEKLDRATYAETLVGFADEIAAPDRSVDAIVAGEFIEHVPPHRVEATLCEFFRVLTLRGRLLLTTPNPNSVWKHRRNTSVMKDPAHASQHYPNALAWRLRAIGYSSIRVRGSGKASRKLGERFPLSLYGSYFLQADKW